MQDVTAQVEIPKRALFKAAEVCDLAKVQPYVLRSWEAEFPELGVAKAAGAPRVYRRVDVEQVLKIKHMLLVEGLTLAGARRKLEELTAPVAGDEPVIEALIGENARDAGNGAAAPPLRWGRRASGLCRRQGSKRPAARHRHLEVDRHALPKRAASVRRKIAGVGT